MLGQCFIQEELERKRWGLVGDFNEETEASTAFAYLQAQGGDFLGASTRWESERAIDWAVQRGGLVTFAGPEAWGYSSGLTFANLGVVALSPAPRGTNLKV